MYRDLIEMRFFNFNIKTLKYTSHINIIACRDFARLNRKITYYEVVIVYFA